MCVHVWVHTTKGQKHEHLCKSYTVIFIYIKITLQNSSTFGWCSYSTFLSTQIV